MTKEDVLIRLKQENEEIKCTEDLRNDKYMRRVYKTNQICIDAIRESMKHDFEDCVFMGLGGAFMMLIVVFLVIFLL